VLLETFKEINRAGQASCGPEYSWSMDELFPVFQYIVVRARILQVAAV
jgi:amyotrophic lateral sclerosis 2 protein